MLAVIRPGIVALRNAQVRCFHVPQKGGQVQFAQGGAHQFRASLHGAPGRTLAWRIASFSNA